MSNLQQRGSRWIEWLGLLLCVYTILPLPFDVNVESRILYQVLATGVLGAWLISLIRRGDGLPASPLNLPLLGLFGVYTLATILSPDPRFTLEGLWQVGIHILLLLMLVDILRRQGTRRVIQPILFAAAVVILVGFVELMAWYFGLAFPLPRQGWFEIGGLIQPLPPNMLRVSSTFGRPTLLAAYLAILIPLSIAWMLSTHSRDTRIGLALWLGGAVTIEALSFSRGGLVSLGASLPVFFVLSMSGRMGWLKQNLSRFKTWQIVGMGAFALVAIAGLAWGWATQDFLGHLSGDVQRLDLWRSAWEIGRDHPLTGVGPLGFGRALRGYRDPLLTQDHLTSPHNGPLLIWAEAGSLGVLAVAILLGVLGVVALRRWHSAQGAEKIRIAGAIAGLVGFAAHHMVDTFLQTPNLLPALLLIAFLILPYSQSAIPQKWRGFAPAALLAALVLSALGWGIADTAQMALARAIRLAQKSDLKGAVESLDSAIRLDPYLGIYQAQKAQYLGALALEDSAYLDRAFQAYQAALANEASYPPMRANQAMLLSQSGDQAAALAAMRQAQALQPDDARLSLWAGDLSAAQQDTAGALRAYAQALTLSPGWIESRYWDRTALRQQARQAFIAAHGLSTLPIQTLGKMWSPCWPGEGYSVPDAPSPAVPAYCEAEKAYYVEGNRQAALADLNSAIKADRTLSASYILRAKIYLEQADLAAANRDGQTALFLQDMHGMTILGQVAEQRGDLVTAEKLYLQGGPGVYQSFGWEMAMYGRRGDITLLPLFESPGPAQSEFTAWLALLGLYESQGRTAEAQAVREAILRLDPTYLLP
jgi:O-antigen ligase/Tfp pilus assembly protein PilF